MNSILAKVTHSSKIPIIILLFLIIAFFSWQSPNFLTTANFLNVFRQISMIGIAGIGMICVMLTGGIDLSISSQVTFVNIMCAYMMVKNGIPPVYACFITLVIATLVGMLNGILVAYGKLMPLISTLCMQNILKGVSFIISKGIPIFGFPVAFKKLGQGYVGIFPIPVIIMALICVIGAVFLMRSFPGRYFYAVGGNEEASRLSGINTKQVKVLAYTVCGFFSGVAGIIWLSRVNSGQPTTGNGFEFDVISGLVLGGVSIMGGSGDVLGAVLGIIVIGLLNNGLILINMGEFYQLLIKGLVLLLAIGIDSFKRNFKGTLMLKFIKSPKGAQS
ncbi:ABC transporter permease [Treponema primitia]|uniref:ABC transporter permease n=1 Tax=Treponema primitia TaxID=88058 RepID=UPI0002DBAFF8|nr:ABC transporter permease [Treponema primitia]